MEIDLYSWPSYFDNGGRLLDEYKLRKTSFFHGLSDDIRLMAKYSFHSLIFWLLFQFQISLQNV